MQRQYRGSRYKVLASLGGGGSGNVFQAQDSLDGRLVALKVFEPGGGEAGGAALARSEFRVLASQAHPGIVRVFDYGTTDDGLAYFSMELVEGRDFLAFARGTARTSKGLAASPVFSEVVRKILEALDYIHRRGLFHLDLKPSNILVTSGDGGASTPKLIDFGFANDRTGASERVSGTLEYLAPERIRGEACDGRADLYSLGIVLHEALTGSCPFQGESARDVIRGHLEGPLPAAEQIPLPYRGLILRLLEKQPQRRPPSARAVLHELFGPPGAESESLPPFGVAFVGREDLLRRLEGAARASARESSRSILLKGAAGSGRSRLLRELDVRLQLEGVATVLAFSRDGERQPGQLIARILRGAAAARGGDSSARSLAADVDALGTAGAAEGRDSETGAAEAEGRRERLLASITESILELASAKPLAILVDDAHRADSLSRDALISLLRAIEHRGGTGLCLVLARRDSDADDQQPNAEVESACKGFQSFELESLPGLDASEVEQFLSRMLGPGAFPQDLARDLAEATGGNVFFIEEYLKLLVRTGRLRSRGAAWELHGGERLEVPGTVEDAIRRRLERLDSGARDALAWAAILDAPVEAEELARYVGDDVSVRETERILSALALEQALSREGTTYSIANAAVRSVAVGALEDGDRRRRHGRIAERLLASSGRVEELAHHLFHSAEPSRAREHLLRAGARARRTGALREAALHFSRWLELGGSDLERFDALLQREEALGHLGRREEQRADIDELQRVAAKMGQARCVREAVLREALYLESLGRKREALERLEQALARCKEDPAAEARLLSRAGMLRFYLSELDAGFESLDRALAYARGAADRALEAECRQLLGLGCYLKGDYDRALQEMGSALAIRREEGEQHRAAALESNIGLVHFDRGALDAAEERFRESLGMFRRLGLRRGEAVNLVNLGLVYLDLGRHEKALDSFLESVRLRRELGDRRGEGADLGNLAAAWIQVGRHERAIPLLEDAIRIARDLENKQSESANEHRLAQIDLERGDVGRAVERFARGLELAQAAGLPAQESVARCGLAKAYLAAQDAARARGEAEAALRISTAGKLAKRSAAVRSILASALLAEGRLDEADRASREAVEELEARAGRSADAHLVWFQRFQVLEARLGDGAGEEALRNAYVHLREQSDAFADEELRQSFLENIAIHREINRLHESVKARNRRDATRRERSFHEITKSIHSILEIDPLLDRLLAISIETTHAEKGLIALKNAGGDFTIRAARGMARESVDDAAEICRSVIADVARGGEPVLAADAGTDDRFRERRSIISFRIRTLMCVPMIVRDEIIGAVYVDGRGASSFNREDLEYLVSFAQLAAIAVENARLLERLRAENVYLRREVETKYRFESLIGKSPAMERLARVMEKIASTPASVLITGETGTGKEVIARSIHYASGRRTKPFVTVDCGALPANLLESELFGHRRGAFSGAIRDRVGLFEEAEGGTLFLDEVTNTTLDLQAKLLRVLQESEIRRVGENHVRKVDVRIIAATNVDIASAVEKGAFREDLFYRLNVIPLEVPPLRARQEDIPLLALHFLKHSGERLSKTIAGFTEEAMEMLSRAPWRGNVRELENLIEKAVILAESDRLGRDFLEGLMPASAGFAKDREALERTRIVPAATSGARQPTAIESFQESVGGLSLEEFDRVWLESERAYLKKVVEDARGNLAEAARRAKVRNRNTLISRLKRHNLKN